MLIRSFDKTVKFRSGEGNYEMATRKTSEAVSLHENGDVDLTNVEPYIDPEKYKFSHPLTDAEWKLLEANPFGYIEFEDAWGEVMEGFIDTDGIEHDSNNKKAEFNLLKVHRQAN